MKMLTSVSMMNGEKAVQAGLVHKKIEAASFLDFHLRCKSIAECIAAGKMNVTGGHLEKSLPNGVLNF